MHNRAAVLMVSVASAAGAAVGWLVSQLFEHIHTEGASGHPVALRHASREQRG